MLNLHEARRLIEIARPTEMYIPILLALTAGLRRSEVLGLLWSDVDFNEGVLRIRQTLQRVKQKTFYYQTKTENSCRVVGLPYRTLEALVEHKEKQERTKKLMGRGYQDNNLVCCRPDGSPIIPSTFGKQFSKFIAEHPEIPKVTFHGLRHTHATLLLELKIQPKVVSERLGHSTINITQDIYTHVMPHVQKEAARLLDKALWRSCLPTKPQNLSPLAISDVAASETAFAVRP